MRGLPPPCLAFRGVRRLVGGVGAELAPALGVSSAPRARLRPWAGCMVACSKPWLTYVTTNRRGRRYFGCSEEARWTARKRTGWPWTRADLKSVRVLRFGLAELAAYEAELTGLLDAFREDGGIELARGACYAMEQLGTVVAAEIEQLVVHLAEGTADLAKPNGSHLPERVRCFAKLQHWRLGGKGEKLPIRMQSNLLPASSKISRYSRPVCCNAPDVVEGGWCQWWEGSGWNKVNKHVRCAATCSAGASGASTGGTTGTRARPSRRSSRPRTRQPSHAPSPSPRPRSC